MNNGEWKLACVGILDRIEEQDLDKSKRNPNIKLILHVRPSEMDAEKEGVEVPESLRFAVMEKDLRRVTTDELEEGQRVDCEGLTTGVRPQLVNLKKLSVLTTTH